MKQLQALAQHAARHRIRGRTYKRNSMLKPLDIMLNALDRCPDPKNDNELGLVIAGSKGLIYEHIRRVMKMVPESAIYDYVDLFFNGVLKDAHHGNANSLLQHERLLRSAYLVYMREELAVIFVHHGTSRNEHDALQAMEQEEEQDLNDKEESEAPDERH